MTHNERINDELLVLPSQEGSARAFEQLLARWQGVRGSNEKFAYKLQYRFPEKADASDVK
ncbi:MAG: hypothetical protein JXM70_16165 [Pirellulales bacterium]|nr:hypothetical protein [Pirellulales bacterium]